MEQCMENEDLKILRKVLKTLPENNMKYEILSLVHPDLLSKAVRSKTELQKIFKRIDYTKRVNEGKCDEMLKGKQLVELIQGLPQGDIRYKILADIPPEKLMNVVKLNKDWWGIYRQINPGTSWDAHVDWKEHVLPTNYFSVTNEMFIASISDLMNEPKWFEARGLYKFQTHQKGGLWKRLIPTSYLKLSRLQIVSNHNSNLLTGFSHDSGRLYDDDSTESKNIIKILKQTSKNLGIDYSPQGRLLLDDLHTYPLIFYMTKVADIKDISLQNEFKEKNQVVWKVYDRSGNVIGRAVGSKYLHEMYSNVNADRGPLYIKGVGVMFDNKNKVAGFGNWVVEPWEMDNLREQQDESGDMLFGMY